MERYQLPMVGAAVRLSFRAFDATLTRQG